MASIANQTQGYQTRLSPASRTPRIVFKVVPRYRTTRVEQFLLMVPIILNPLQDTIPSVAGFSSQFFVFAVLVGYVVLCRLGMLTRVWLHPVFKAACAFLCLGLLMEFSQASPGYAEIFRTGQMVTGAVLMASLCRDRQALRAGLAGYILAGIYISVFLFFTSYGALQVVTVTTFDAATQIRTATFSGRAILADLNEMAFISTQGAVVALALALTCSSALWRNVFFGITLFCTIASLLPLSRGSFIILIVSCATVMFAFGCKRGKAILLASMVTAGTIIWAPDAIWSRMTFSTQAHQGRVEARARLYTAAVEHLPEYILTGVGVANFWGSWGEYNGFAGPHGVIGAHNCFFQVTIYWGLAGFLALLAVIWQAYRCFPKHCGNDALALSLLGIAVSVCLLTLVVPALYSKGFALGLGVLVGAYYWIWPRGLCRGIDMQRRVV